MTNQSANDENPALTAAALRDLEQRPARLWHVDGLVELTMGAVWLLWGGAWLFGHTLSKPAANWYWMVVPFLLVFTGTISNWTLKKLKRRITAPRAGYVEMKDPGRAPRIVAAVVAAAVAAGLAGIVASGKALDWQRLFGPGVAVLLAIAFVVGSVRMRAPHLLLLAAWTAAGGFVITPVRPDFEGMEWLFVWIGAGSVLLGAVRLYRFLRANPPAGEERA